jgi:RNA polymerase sigma factor (sigma-70 family)
MQAAAQHSGSFQAFSSARPETLVPIVRKVVGKLITRPGRVHEREDLAQTVLLHLLGNGGRALATWNPQHGTPFAAYAACLARRAAISALRGRQRNHLSEVAHDPIELPESSEAHESEEQLAEREHARLLLVRARTALSPLGKRVFDVLFVEERDIDAASRELGMSEEALYTWRTRIRRHTRQVATSLELECA